MNDETNDQRLVQMILRISGILKDFRSASLRNTHSSYPSDTARLDVTISDGNDDVRVFEGFLCRNTSLTK
jgi:hypothetical protein